MGDTTSEIVRDEGGRKEEKPSDRDIADLPEIDDPPEDSESEIPIEKVNAFLKKFKRHAIPKDGSVVLKKVDDGQVFDLRAVQQALMEKRWDDVLGMGKAKYTTPEAKKWLAEQMLKDESGRKVMKRDPEFGGALLSAADPALLAGKDFGELFGSKKNEITSQALLTIAEQANISALRKLAARRNGEKPEEMAPFDPAMFTLLQKKLPRKVWNDSGKAIGDPKRGLSARVCRSLWLNGDHDQICELIKRGVDTTLPAQVAQGGMGIYSDFVLPLQHTIQKHLKDVPKLNTAEAASWSEERKEQVKGAKQIFETLDEHHVAATLTKWDAVEGSEMIRTFKKNPGTIWGFEEIRHPFVQAAHDTKQGKRPLRMMELWTAVGDTLGPDTYAELLDDPDTAIAKAVKKGEQTISDMIDRNDAYAELRTGKAAFLKQFRKDAEAFLRDFAQQLPKGTYVRNALDTQGVQRPQAQGAKPEKRPELGVSDVAGVHFDKFMSSFACKAGLWWAKNNNQPVYYCLDGIDMNDVINYKKVKHKAIEQFLADGGATTSSKPHREVVTMQELREILAHWDEFKGTVQFVQKGDILKGKALEDSVTDWRDKMKQANTEAGRSPAPPRADFAQELANIDAGLPARLDQAAKYSDPAEVDKDARDIVRKSGYLLKMANTRPHIVLKYLMSKCDVLSQYGLIPPGLPAAAARLGKLSVAHPAAKKAVLQSAAAGLVSEIQLCPPKFQGPLATAMVRYPLIQRNKTLRSQLKPAAL